MSEAYNRVKWLVAFWVASGKAEPGMFMLITEIRERPTSATGRAVIRNYVSEQTGVPARSLGF